MAEGQGFSQHEGRLRHGAFFRVDQDENAVHHAQSPFDFTAEVGVPWRIDDIDFYALVNHTGVLGTDCDSALSFLVHRVHDPFAHIVDLTVDMGLSEYRVDQCRFAMVDVGDDRDVSNIAPALFGFELGCHGRFCCGCLIHRYCCMLQKKDAQKPRRRTAVYPKHDVGTSDAGEDAGWRASTGKNSSFEASYGQDIRHIGTFRFDYFGMNRARNSTNWVWCTLSNGVYCWMTRKIYVCRETFMDS